MSQGAAGAQGADILWTAYIDDHTDEFFRRMEMNLSLVNNGVINFQTNITNSFNRIRQGSGRAAKGVLTLAGAFGALHLISHIFGPIIRQLKEFGQETVDLAADANMLESVLLKVGQSAGYSEGELTRLEKVMTSHGITIRGARQIMLEMVQTNLDLADAQELVARAQDVAIARDLDFTEVAQSMIHAIATLNPLVLRRRGIIVDFEQAYRDYARSVDKAWESLSTEEKQMVATQATLKATLPLVGAYEAAMGEVGGQVRLLAPMMENFQVTLGQVFQPAYAVVITHISDALRSAQRWLDENVDAAAAFGDRLAGALETGIALLNEFVKILEALPKVVEVSGEAIVSLGEVLASSLAPAFDIEAGDLEKRIDNLGTAAKQAATIIVASLSAGITMIGQGVEVMLETVGIAIDVVTYQVKEVFGRNTQRDVDRINQRMAGLMTDIMGLGDEVTTSFNNAAAGMSRATGLLPKIAEEAEQAGGKINDVMGRIRDQTLDAVAAIEELNDAIAEDLAKQAIAIERQDFEENIRLFRQLTDSYRDYLRSLEDIRRRHNRQLADLEDEQAEDERKLAEDQQDKRIDIEEDYAEERLKIEREYIRDLEDIQRHYMEDVGEAARQNDAVAVAQLMRQRVRQRRDAAIERDRDLEDAKRDYEKELDDLKDFQEKRRKEIKKDAARRLLDLQESLDEQLEDAEIARKREKDDLELYNKRRQEDIALQRKWEMEDLMAKHEDEREELGRHLADLADLSDASIEYLLDTHGEYIKDDLLLWENYYNQRKGVEEDFYTRQQPYGPGTYGGYAYYEEPGTPTVRTPPTPAPTTTTPPAPTIGGSPYDIPPDILELCRRNPNATVCKWYGLAGGGAVMTSGTPMINTNEGARPELVVAIPMGGAMDINLRGKIDVTGVSSDTERDVSKELLRVIKQAGEAIGAGMGR